MNGCFTGIIYGALSIKQKIKIDIFQVSNFSVTTTEEYEPSLSNEEN